MAITDYASLQSTVSRWVGGSSDSAFPDAIRDAIGLAEQEMNTGTVTDGTVMALRVPEMEKRVSFTVDGKYEAIPQDCLELIGVWRIDGEKEVPLGAQPLTNVAWASKLSGSPKFYALSGKQIRFAPTSTDEWTVRLAFYARLPNLSDATACTSVLQNYPLLYLYGTLAALEGYLVADERIAVWKQQYVAALKAANNASARRLSSYAA